jgi:hypothetical protein
VTELTIFFNWATVLVQENGEPYYFPGRFTPHFRRTYAVPAVYRWRVLKRQPGEKETIYIGEAEELARRIQRVLTPSATAKDSDTNKRLHQFFRNCLLNQKIVIDVLRVEPFEINGVRLDQQSVGDRFKRRALENLALIFAQASGEFELLNIFIDPLDKARELLLRNLKPHQVREAVKRFGLDKLMS